MNTRRVVKGGAMCNSTRPVVSPDTQKLLKVMMEESKLTNFQRKQLSKSMQEGKSLPVTCNPTSSYNKKPSPVKPSKQTPRVMTGRNLTSGKRRKEIIDHQKALERETEYRPPSGKYISADDKELFQNKMTYGKDFEKFKVKREPKRVVVEVEEIDRFEAVLLEIEDRREFLREMEQLGQGKKYRAIIETEISQKIRELELIDRARMAELDEAQKQENGEEK